MCAAVRVLSAVLCAAAASPRVVGAILTGTVHDPSGAAVPNAAVTFRNAETGIVTVVQTNGAGSYSAPNLLPGEYTVSAEASGLTSGALQALTLTVGEKQILDIDVRLRTVAESVDVTGGGRPGGTCNAPANPPARTPP